MIHFLTIDPSLGSPVVSKVKARPRNVRINSFVFEQYSPGWVAPNEESIWVNVGVTLSGVYTGKTADQLIKQLIRIL